MSIELINFSKKYSHSNNNDDYSVKDVSFICKHGEITGLVGENGSGKSTIIKAITGYHYPTEGKVILTDLNGNEINVSLHPEKARLITGYVPEVNLLPLSEKVSDLFKFFSCVYNVLDYSDVVSKFSIDSVMDKKIKVLSKGYKQRVAFALAFLHNPSVIVLDEPISGLDPAQIIQMRNIILNEACNKTILISTHILSEVHALCNTVHVMKNGILVTSGTENEIIKNTGSKTFEEAFLKL
ncbi:MAG: ABC transporter ATP-binding protein [Treponema sp.]|nr:ABC transporter ATP-binding protein [Treponema sp.]